MLEHLHFYITLNVQYTKNKLNMIGEMKATSNTQAIQKQERTVFILRNVSSFTANEIEVMRTQQTSAQWNRS